jgi:hypothetical protein
MNVNKCVSELIQAIDPIISLLIPTEVARDSGMISPAIPI